MADDDDLDILVSVPTEVEAAAIVNALAERGIQATASGGLTAGFKAEAPGEVQVLVHAADLEPARDLLAKAHPPKSAPAAGSGPIFFVCDSCGKRVTFAADARGTIQSCPECGEWLDVPDGGAG